MGYPDKPYDVDGRVLEVGDLVVSTNPDLAHNTAVVRGVHMHGTAHLIWVVTDHPRYVSVVGCASGYRWLDPDSDRARRFVPSVGNPDSAVI